MTLQSTRGASRIDLLHGTLDMLILRTLQWGPQHGYAIGQTIRAQSSDVLRVEAGSLYPALQRLAKRGWVASKWGQTDAQSARQVLPAYARRQDGSSCASRRAGASSWPRSAA